MPAGGRDWGGKKAGLWLGYDVWVDGGFLRAVTSPAQRGRSDAVAAGRGCVAVTCGATPTSASPSPSPEARPLPEGEVAALLPAQHSSIRESDMFATPASPSRLVAAGGRAAPLRTLRFIITAVFGKLR